MATIPPEPPRPQESDPAAAFEAHARWVEQYGSRPAAAHTKRFDGDYLVWRKAGQHLRKGVTQPGAEAIKRGRSTPPRFRHPDQASAEREAERLALLCPGTTFVVIHEVARVKVEEAAHG